MAEIAIVVRRQDGPTAPSRQDIFAVPASPRATVADALGAIAADPRTVDGRQVTPMVGASWCTHPVCGVCTMRIDGRPRPACMTPLSDARRGRMTLEPLRAFPVRCDLWVDRSRLRRDFAQLQAGAGFGPMNDASRCTRCGACLDVCPEVRRDGGFVGPAAIAVAASRRLAPPQLEALLAPNGVAACSHAAACEVVCPEGIAVEDHLGDAARAAVRWWRRR